jgi:predicted flavoprotein YhiN
LLPQVVVLERTREAGKKVLMSGGTRCNVLPQDVDLLVRLPAAH